MNHPINNEYLERAKTILLSTVKIDLNSWEDESTKLNYLNREDIYKLAENISLLEGHDLQILNEKLHTSGRKVNDFLSEHTFAAELIRYHGWRVKILYEPQAGKKTDFVVIFDDFKEKVFNIQMKNSSQTERENRRDKIFRKIKKELKKVKCARYYCISMAEDFSDLNIPEFIEFIIENADKPDGLELPYYFNGQLIAKITFSEMTNPQGDCLLPGVRGDMDFVNITGEEREHFYNALKKAAISFDSSSENDVINLIVSEANNKDNIDVAEAIYGDEYFTIDSNDMRRYGNGFYHSEDSKNVTAVVTLKKREESKKISSFSKSLFIKHVHDDAGEAILALLKLDRIIGPKQYISHRY